MMTFSLKQGSSPLLVSMPHIASSIPPEYAADFVPAAWAAPDTDWHLDLLYNFLPTLGASVLQPTVSRYVIDLNRPPDDAPMYPGAANTELCPTHFFSGEPLYRAGAAPDTAAIAERRTRYWQPYHSTLAAELQRIKAIHGYAILWDAHSICSVLPWLFEGKLPDLNIGTANGAAADERITAAVASACAEEQGITSVVNGRFKGGYITRHYGQPAQHIHAIQLEKCWSLYMQETTPYAYDAHLAGRIQPILQRMMQAALDAAAAVYRDNNT